MFSKINEWFLSAVTLLMMLSACSPAAQESVKGDATPIAQESAENASPVPTHRAEASETMEATATALPPRAEDVGDWELHTISDHYGGPDGVKLVDVNGDGWMDISTAYEWSGDLMLFLHPGKKKVEAPWPALQIGNVGSGEDSLAIDLNGDGNLDLISAHEGDELVLSVHWAPRNPEQYRNADQWKEDYIRVSREHSWLFLVPMDVNGDGRMDVVAGSKDDRDLGREAVGELAWLEAPDEESGGWVYNKIGRLNWPMSIIPFDVDQDGDEDLLVSDRRGAEERKGMRWFENPGKNWADEWAGHYVAGLEGVDPFFVGLGDLDGDGAPELVVPIEDPLSIVLVSLAEALSDESPGEAIPLTYAQDFGEGHFKSVAVGDIDLDGFAEIVVTLVDGDEGLGYFDHPEGAITDSWTWIPLIEDIENPKFDIVRLYDMDGDGDLDIVTTEDVSGLGVIWLENPYAAGGN